MKVPFIDLVTQHREVESDIRKGLEEVIQSSRFILGPAVEKFEESMASYHGVRHAVGVASGTDALLLALLAAGVGPGDEVVTTPFTFVATAEVIVHAGAKPVFADIEADTFNIDPARVEEKITARTRAVLPVHLYGHPADMKAVGALAAEKGLVVIEDCAQSTGARVGERLTGSLGKAGGFSFFPTKNLGCLGDGGMVLTDDDEVASTLRMLRGHGASGRDRYELSGYNSRLDAIQAAVLDVKLPRLEEWNERRRRNAAIYREILRDVEEVVLPVQRQGVTHAYNQFTVMTPKRDELRQYLGERNVGSMIYYSECLHLQPVLAHLGYGRGDFPVAERARDQVLSLPICPGLTEAQVSTAAEAVRAFFRD
jgi:dTDP-4-amino-4,6-dideoxygalactose transaminase